MFLDHIRYLKVVLRGMEVNKACHSEFEGLTSITLYTAKFWDGHTGGDTIVVFGIRYADDCI